MVTLFTTTTKTSLRTKTRGIDNMKNITTFNFKELSKFDKIFVLISGGMDSTYLYEMIYPLFPEKTFCVNCWNPYEQSKSLSIMAELPNFIEVRPTERISYKDILIDSFNRIPKVIEARKRGKYEKKMFPCCKYIKHDAFKKHPLFQEQNTVVISGIKSGDGQMRGWFLKDLRNPPKKHNYATPIKQGFYHRHKEGQLYCYPFRDYQKRELPKHILKELRNKYPKLTHSGCILCPVLVVFRDKFTAENTINSVKFYNKLIGQKLITDFGKIPTKTWENLKKEH